MRNELLLLLLLYPAPHLATTFVMPESQKVLVHDETKKALEVGEQMEVHRKLLNELIIAKPDPSKLTGLGNQLKHGETHGFPTVSIEEQATQLSALSATVLDYARVVNTLLGPDARLVRSYRFANSLLELRRNMKLLRNRVFKLVQKQPHEEEPKPMDELLATQILDACSENQEIIYKVLTYHVDFLRLLNVNGDFLRVLEHKQTQQDGNEEVSKLFLNMCQKLLYQNSKLLHMLAPYTR